MPKALVVDPIATAIENPKKNAPSLIAKQPLAAWFEGLLHVKEGRGRKYSWEDMKRQLEAACTSALKPHAKIVVGGTVRRITAEERALLTEFIRRDYSVSAISYLAQRTFPQLWERATGKKAASA